MNDQGFQTLTSIMESRRSVRAYLREKPDRADIATIISAAKFAPNSCNLQHYGFIYIDDDDVLARMKKIATGKVAWAPALIVMINDTRFSVKRHAGLQSLAAGAMNVILAAQAKGLGTCWMAGFGGDRDIIKLLGVPDYYEVTGLMSIGYPDPNKPHDATYRVPSDLFTHWNKFSGPDTSFPHSRNVDRWTLPQVVDYGDRIGSVYAPRKQIALHHRDMIDAATDVFASLTARYGLRRDVSSHLDYASYDANFYRALKTKSLAFSSTTLSNYSRYFQNLTKEHYPETDCALLSDKTQLIDGGSDYDVISCVFKLEFFPDTHDILEALMRCCKDGGYLFVAGITAYSPRGLGYQIQSLAPDTNVYEGNKLYKFGPHRFYSAGKLQRLIRRAGWQLVERGSAGKEMLHRFSWWWLKKVDVQ